jgi:membrane protease subunit HflK
VQHLGNYHPVAGPGLHFKIPLGVASVVEVPVKRQLKEEFGFDTSGATFTEQIANPMEWELETTIVTEDLNTGLVEWVIQKINRIEKRILL